MWERSFIGISKVEVSVKVRKLSVLVVLLSLAGPAAYAQDTCPQKCDLGKDALREPHVIEADGGVLDTILRIEMKDHQVPVWEKDSGGNWQCCMRTMSLRTYGYPTPNGYEFDLPGPTLKVHKAAAPGGAGDRIRVQLVNALPPEPHQGCAECTGCGTPQEPRCCRAKEVMPNCFHGANTTNLHFHGSHASPQAPQDYVLLDLLPEGSDTAHASASHSRGSVAVGTYQYDVEPLRWTQPEGTHWYHPHKHGAVGVQVSNGMAGALLVEGPFDDWLRQTYGGKLRERLLIIQQVQDRINFLISPPPASGSAPQPIVNGQASPYIEMCAGEIQRWRFVSATMQGSAQLRIDLDGPGSALEARQIAMDGIRFARENYERQPLLTGLKQFNLSPGNRADFLIKAPKEPRMYEVTYDIFGHLETLREEGVLKMLESRAPGPAEPSLLRIKVTACRAPAMSFPDPIRWPAMPDYLGDINDTCEKRSLWFQVTGNANQVYVGLADGELRQYNPSCVDITTKLGTAEEWTIYNNLSIGKPFHVFHIHTNPFQVVKNGPTTFQPPYIWQDSITLPDASQGPVVVRQRYDEFTGEYVLHCHFLGHEDRGMMLSVQTVCPESSPERWFFGKTRSDQQPECQSGNYIPGAPRCSLPAP
jgi:FtsP/CotA-like multicopper oxidase with cupredoxin domain